VKLADIQILLQMSASAVVFHYEEALYQVYASMHLCRVIQQQFRMKEYDILGVKTYSDVRSLLHKFRGSKAPNIPEYIYAPAPEFAKSVSDFDSDVTIISVKSVDTYRYRYFQKKCRTAPYFGTGVYLGSAPLYA